MQRRVHEAQCHHFSRRGFRSTGPVRISMAAALLMGGFLVADVSLLGAVPAAAVTTTLYAYPSGTASSPTSCPETATASSECTLTQALSLAAAGNTVALATSAAHYVGNFTISAGTVSAPVTIAPALGVTDPILDGNGGSATACPTTACSGPVLNIVSGFYATIEGITVQDAFNTVIASPFGQRGGAVYNGGTATLTNDTFSGDSATQYAGGVFSDADSTITLTDDTFSGDSANYGGGVFINAPATATLTDDTFSGDSAASGGGYGGGVLNNGTATLTDDTFSGDSATLGAGYGGAVFNENTATLTDDTFSGDTANFGGGIDNDGTASISNSVLNSAPCQGTITDGGYNVESDNTCGFVTHDVVNSTTIHLASSLAPNGSTGPETLAIGTNSSAYEEVPSAECTPTTDERGDPRPGFSGKNCDAGAFEYQQPTPTTPSISNLPASGTYGGGFTATVSTTGDGTKSVTSNSTGICTASGLVVSYVGVGQCSLTAHVATGTVYAAADGTAQTFSVGSATPTAPSISNLPTGAVYGGGGFTATVSTTGDGTTSVTSNSTSICTASGLAVSYVGAGMCSLTAHVAAGTDYTAADGSAQTFSVGKATPSTTSIFNLPGSGVYGGSFTAVVSTDGDGTQSVTSNSTGVCTVGGDGLTVSYVGVGQCSLTAHVAAGTDYEAADGSAQTFSVGKATPTKPSISNPPASGIYGGGFTATVSTKGDGRTSVTSTSTGVCTASGLVVSYVGVGQCSLTAHVAAGTDYEAADGSAQTFSVGKATTKTALKLSVTKVTYGHEQTEHLSVTVSPQLAGSKPTGTVTVKASTGALCAITLSSGKGSCTLSAKKLNAGTYHLVATYGGSSNFKGSASTKETLTIVK